MCRVKLRDRGVSRYRTATPNTMGRSVQTLTFDAQVPHLARAWVGGGAVVPYLGYL